MVTASHMEPLRPTVQYAARIVGVRAEHAWRCLYGTPSVSMANGDSGWNGLLAPPHAVWGFKAGDTFRSFSFASL
jgi:hypothetical protein